MTPFSRRRPRPDGPPLEFAPIASDYNVEACLLIGVVIVACEVFSSSRPGVVGFHVVPVNAEYNDCAICTTDGEEVRYEVDGYLGRGERGDFASLS